MDTFPSGHAMGKLGSTHPRFSFQNSTINGLDSEIIFNMLGNLSINCVSTNSKIFKKEMNSPKPWQKSSSEVHLDCR